jgi:hypothetical protein
MERQVNFVSSPKVTLIKHTIPTTFCFRRQTSYNETFSGYQPCENGAMIQGFGDSLYVHQL